MNLRELNKKNMERSEVLYPNLTRAPSKKVAGILQVKMSLPCDLLTKAASGDSYDERELELQIGEAVVVADYLCGRLGLSLERGIKRYLDQKAPVMAGH